MSPCRPFARRRARQLALLAGLALAAAGCGGGAPSSSPTAGGPGTAQATPAQPATAARTAAAATTPGAPAPPRPAAAIAPKDPDPGPPLPPISYDAKGRRDPFVPVSLAKERPGLTVGTFKLAGVIRGRTLLALIEAPDGLGYILKPGDVLGNGRVTEITASSVTFAVAGKDPQGATATLRLSE